MRVELKDEPVPFLITPEFVERVWGFADLRPWVDREPDGRTIGEVWLSGDDCVAASGPWAGRRIGDLFQQYPRELLGNATAEAASPLLIKLIFAREKLSVQVHPDDAMARKYGAARGKTECWAVLQAEPGATVAVGLRAGITIADVERGIREKTLEQMLEIVPVSKGELIYVDAGTIHAILPGSALLEVQQNCDVTYRLYDYGRPRELHVEKGLEALRLRTEAGKVAPHALQDRTVLIEKQYFRIERMTVGGARAQEQLECGMSGRLNYIYVAKGTGNLQPKGAESIALSAQSMVLAPARSGGYSLQCEEPMEIYRIIDMAHGSDGD